MEIMQIMEKIVVTFLHWFSTLTPRFVFLQKMYVGSKYESYRSARLLIIRIIPEQNMLLV